MTVRRIGTENVSYEEMKEEISWQGGGAEKKEGVEIGLYFVICAYLIEFSHDTARHSSLRLIVLQVARTDWQTTVHISQSKTFETINTLGWAGDVGVCVCV